MKRKTAVLLLIFFVFSAVVVGVAYWQWNNITAIRYAITYTPEKRQEIQKKTEQVMEQIAKQYPAVDFSKLPDEGVTMLIQGELAEEVAVAVLTGQIPWEEAKLQPMELPETIQPIEKVTATEVTEQTQEFSDSVSGVDSILARIYVLRSGYTGKIEGLVNQALSDYRSKKGTKRELMAQYLKRGNALEGECDRQMEALLTELSAELNRTGGDITLVGQIRSVYQQEKSIKKAELIGRYQK